MSSTLESLPGEVMPPRIGVDEVPYSFVRGLYHDRLREKLFNPHVDEAATEKLLALREQWRAEGDVTVFTSGVFDLLHLDHAGYLLHTKIAGTRLAYEESAHGCAGWDELPPAQKLLETENALVQNRLRLIVSVDGSQSVAERKSGKAGAQRPIYGWETRSLTVAGLAFPHPSPAQSHVNLSVADAVTIHGPADFEEGHPHAVHFDLVELLQPDVWAIYGESTDILEEAPLHAGLGEVALHCIKDRDGTTYFADEFIGKMSTSGVVKRIQGT